MDFFLNHNYRYAIEQMLFSLFPGQKPVYPEVQTPGADAIVSTLTCSETTALAQLAFTWQGTTYHGQFSRPIDPDMTDLQRDRAIQHALKQSFYLAGVQALDRPPTWGALSGVRPVKLPTQALLRGDSPEQAQRELVETYHVAPLRGKLALDCARASLDLMPSLLPNGVSVYVGIPFCPTRCSYCSFVSADVHRTLKLVEPFLDLLCQEIAHTGRILKETGRVVQTLYIGGGTPTTLSTQQLDRLLTQIRTHLPIQDGAEFTLEAGRADTITREKLALLAPHGVGRVSINPQTMKPHVLKALGRTHSVQDILDCYHMARSIPNLEINMDLIAGLPQDSLEGFCHSLRTIADLEPENITVHTLALKKGSTLTRSPRDLSTVDQVGQMLDFAWQTLAQRGYTPYYLYRQKYMSGGFENISWTKPGHPNRYNILMMEELQSVISLGGGGITKLLNHQTGSVLRLSNAKYPHDYLRDPEKVMEQKEKLLRFWGVDPIHIHSHI